MTGWNTERAEAVARITDLLRDLWRETVPGDPDESALSGLAGELLRWPIEDVERVVGGWPGEALPDFSAIRAALALPRSAWVGWSASVPRAVRRKLIDEFGAPLAVAWWRDCAFSADMREVYAPTGFIAETIRSRFAARARGALGVESLRIEVAAPAGRAAA